MQSTDPFIATALERLAQESDVVAAAAADAFCVLTAGGGPQTLSQLMLQRFLWVEVPRRWPPRGRPQVVEGLARLLELAGYGRYAAICRSADTATVLNAWLRSDKRGMTQAAKAEQRSGVTPPDLPTMKWSGEAGPAEIAAYLAAAATLEMSVASGELTPGSRGWRERRTALAAECLHRTRPELDGASHAQLIAAERTERWIREGTVERAQLLAAVQPVITSFREPDDLSALEPVQWLLRKAADSGIPVRGQGDAAPDVVREMTARFDLTIAGPGDETDAISMLVALLVDAGAAIRGRSTVDATAHGEDLASEPERLWRTIVHHLWSRADFPCAAAELAFATLLRDGPQNEVALADRIHPMLAPMWRDVELGLPTRPQETRLALIRIQWVGGPLGVFDVEGSWPAASDPSPWPARTLSLTRFGTATALEALRVRACQLAADRLS